MARPGAFDISSIFHSRADNADLAGELERALHPPTRPQAIDGLYLRPIPDALFGVGRDFNLHGLGHAMSDRRARIAGYCDRKPLLRRARSEARLQAKGREQVPESGADELPVQELVVPHDIQRAPDAGKKPDAGVRELSKPDGLTPAQMGSGRRRTPG